MFKLRNDVLDEMGSRELRYLIKYEALDGGNVRPAHIKEC